MAYSREIIKIITQYVRFRVPRTNEKDSYYTEIGNNLIRISNHCTWMKVWDNMLKENPKWQGKPIISIVFEDNGNTFSEECLFSLGYRRRPIRIREYVYNSSSLSKQDITLIIKSLQNLTKSNNFIDLSKKGVLNNRISVCPDYNNIETSSDETPSKGGYNGADFVPESKQNNNENINCNINMDKNRIRLTESQLHRVIKESVKKVLRERVDYDNLSNTEITQQVRLEFNTALENAHKAIEQECQELLSSDFWMDGVYMNNQMYYDWVRDRLREVIAPTLSNILPVA